MEVLRFASEGEEGVGVMAEADIGDMGILFGVC